MDNKVRLRVSGREVTVNYDLDAMRGDVLETLEENLGGDSIYSWLKKWQDALAEGVRLSEFRTRDIIGLVYLGMAQADPETTWQHVSRSIAPYTVEFLPQETKTVPGPPPAEPLAPALSTVLPPPVVSPDAHQTVPPAFVPPTTSPLQAALHTPPQT